MKIKDIYESFNSSYDIHFTTQKRAYFITRDGETYVVEFKGMGTPSDPTEITFYWVDSLTNDWMHKGKNVLPYQSQHPMQILSTVAKAVEIYVKRNQPAMFFFTGKGPIGETYKRMLSMHHFAFLDEYRMTHKRSLGEHIFEFERW